MSYKKYLEPGTSLSKYARQRLSRREESMEDEDEASRERADENYEVAGDEPDRDGAAAFSEDEKSHEGHQTKN